MLTVILAINGKPEVSLNIDTPFTYLHQWEMDEILDKYSKQYAIDRKTVSIHLTLPLITVNGLIR
jgi:hypothetical protein